MAQVQCHCDKIVSYDFSPFYDLDEESEVLDDIKEGRFMTVRCPDCGRELKLEEDARFVWPSRGQQWSYYPEIKRDSFMLGRLQPAAGTTRVIFGYRQLVEKILAFESELDDRVLEALKFSFLQKHAENGPITMFFHGEEAGKLVFYVEGLKENEIGVTGLPRSAYEQARKELEEHLPNAWKVFLTPPYVNVDQVEEDPEK